jgi:hypothetical protein
MFRRATISVAAVASMLGFVDMAGAQQADVPILSLKESAGGPPGPLATPAGRVLIGRGKDYQPVSGTKDQQVLFDELMKSMKARRDFGWKVVEQLLQPVKVTLPTGTQVDVPLWQTWYDGLTGSDTGDPTDEIGRLFLSYFQKLKANPTGDKAALADQALAELAQKNLAESITVAKLTTALRQNATVSTDMGGQGRTMFSPSFVKHMMVSAKEVENCSFVGIKPTTPAPSPTNFSHCIKEFPRDAVMIKTSWKDLSAGVAVHDNSSAAQAAVIAEGTWPGANHPVKRPPTVVPTRNQIYTNETRDGRQFGLVGIHLVTKDVREWVWVSLWWSPDATKDFGADRPAGIGQFNGGVWSNYKMCVNSSFDEGDPQPWSYYTGAQATLGDSIKSTYDTIQSHVNNGIVGTIIAGLPDNVLPPTARGPWAAPHNKNTSWCSNPSVEVQLGNGRTSCIGCHQLVLTESLRNPTQRASFNEAMLGVDPQFARSRNFNNFSTDFSWAFQFQYQTLIKAVRDDVGFNWP